MIRVHLVQGRPLDQFDQYWAVQLNDTHPSIAVAELMRLLVDVHRMDWDKAWQVTRRTCAYTNHTLLPEALETWPVSLFEYLLPRHLEIIYAINHSFLQDVRAKFPGDEARVAGMSLINESGQRSVRMANLAAVGSYRVNGVAQLHSDLLRDYVMHDFARLWPEKFCNITNGVTPRRFVALANPGLAQLLTERVGQQWPGDLTRLRGLEELAEDAEFQQQWSAVKHAAKSRLASLILQRTGITVDPRSLFDIHAKRIHEYKRQHLNILHVLTLYRQIKYHQQTDMPGRTFIFGGKAAPGYYLAKLIIKLIHAAADLINNDPAVSGCLKVVFYPDFNVKNAQPVYPAADLSEQISLAGKEASGTGNMKFSLNGALTIGTLDGANVEIRREVGPENFFLFGMTADEVRRRIAEGYYPEAIYHQNPMLKETLDFITSGALGGDGNLFRPLVENLIRSDPFLVLADFESYVQCQQQVSQLWRNPQAWCRASILNTARMGYFSSDRSIQDYCEKVWNVQPVTVDMEAMTHQE
jgi:starch phosphorylase